MPESELLSLADKELLLTVARGAIAARLDGVQYRLPASVPMHLRELGAAFVSLHLKGALRGCIGNIEATEALIENVRKNALNAAFNDPRFPPLRVEEFPGLEIEISVLTPAVAVASPAEIEVGRHGVILQQGMARAVFLPQVAPAQGWDRETMLMYLSRKAGLSADAWRQAKLEVFEAIVFGESHDEG